MRAKLLLTASALALASSLAFGDAHAQTVVPNQSEPIQVTTGTTTVLISSPAANQSIHITHFDLFASGTGGAQFEYGTAGNCSTGTTNLTGNYSMTAGTNTSVGDGSATVLNVPPGEGVCLVTSASVTIAGSLAWEQF